MRPGHPYPFDDAQVALPAAEVVRETVLEKWVRFLGGVEWMYVRKFMELKWPRKTHESTENLPPNSMKTPQTPRLTRCTHVHN